MDINCIIFTYSHNIREDLTQPHDSLHATFLTTIDDTDMTVVQLVDKEMEVR